MLNYAVADQIRRDRGITVQQIADHDGGGWSRTHINNVLKGRRSCSADLLIRIADVLGVASFRLLYHPDDIEAIRSLVVELGLTPDQVFPGLVFEPIQTPRSAA